VAAAAPSLTALDLKGNHLDGEVRSPQHLRSTVLLPLTSACCANQALAPAVRANSTLRRLNLRYNAITPAAEKALREAVRARVAPPAQGSGEAEEDGEAFELLL
jgi:hypothetical protein